MSIPSSSSNTFDISTRVTTYHVSTSSQPIQSFSPLNPIPNSVVIPIDRNNNSDSKETIVTFHSVNKSSTIDPSNLNISLHAQPPSVALTLLAPNQMRSPSQNTSMTKPGNSYKATIAEQVRELTTINTNTPDHHYQIKTLNISHNFACKYAKINIKNSAELNDEIMDLQEEVVNKRQKRRLIMSAFILAGIGIAIILSGRDETSIILTAVFCTAGLTLLGTQLIRKLVFPSKNSEQIEQKIKELSQDILVLTESDYPTFPKIATAQIPMVATSLSNNNNSNSLTSPKSTDTNKQPEKKSDGNSSDSSLSSEISTLSNILHSYNQTSNKKSKQSITDSCCLLLTLDNHEEKKQRKFLKTLENMSHIITKLHYPRPLIDFDLLINHPTGRNAEWLQWEFPLQFAGLGKLFFNINSGYLDNDKKQLFQKLKVKIRIMSFNYITGQFYSPISCAQDSLSTTPRCLSFAKRIELIKGIFNYLEKKITLEEMSATDLDAFESSYRNAKNDDQHNFDYYSKRPIPQNNEVVRVIQANPSKYQIQNARLNGYPANPLTLKNFAKIVSGIAWTNVNDDSKKTRRQSQIVYESATALDLDLLRRIPDDTHGHRTQFEHGVQSIKEINESSFKKLMQSKTYALRLVEEYLAFSFDAVGNFLNPNPLGSFKQIQTQQDTIKDAVDMLLNSETR